MENVLNVINEEMKKLGIDYYYLTNTSESVTYPYVTGEYYESGYTFEDGSTEANLLLEAWTRGSNLDLVRLNDDIKEYFKDFRTIKDGCAIHISYASNYPRRTNDINLKKIEINLDIRYWKGVNTWN